MKHLVAFAGILTLLNLPATAQDVITPLDPVPEHPEVTYLDLLQKVIPDLDLHGPKITGHLPAGIRHIDGPDAGGEVPDPVQIDYVDARRMEAGGKPTIWVIADLGEGGNLGTYTLLAVFDGREEFKFRLIDAVEVDTDRFTGFDGYPFAISGEDEAMLISSSHSNSSQSYQTEDLAFVREGKLALVDTFFVYGEHVCNFRLNEVLAIRATSGGKGYWPIKVTISHAEAKTSAEDCLDPQPKDFTNKEYSATYVWDEAADKYATASQELKDLAKANSERF
jgi:hypothetical protein